MTLTTVEASQLFRDEPHRYLDVGNGEVAYRVVGSGPDVLFVHGWPVSGATFRTLLPYLTDHMTCHIIDFPGFGSSRFTDADKLSFDGQIQAVRSVLDLLKLESVSVVGHDAGGLIARHALVGDPRLRSMALINTEPSESIGWRFEMFVAARHLPGFGRAFGWIAGQPRLRRLKLVIGDAFADRSHLDGEFDSFFLKPINQSRRHQNAAEQVLRTFRKEYLRALKDIHQRIDVPVHLIWGDKDPFFPVSSARAMVKTFPSAHLTEIPGAGLFCHEEQPEAVAKALLGALTN